MVVAVTKQVLTNEKIVNVCCLHFELWYFGFEKRNLSSFCLHV